MQTTPGGPATPTPDVVPGPVPGTLRAAAVVLGLEAIALVGAAGVLVVKTLVGTPDDLGRALFAAVMALLAALVLGAGARGLRRLRPGMRTPVVLLQLLALPVAYTLWIQADLPAYGAPIMVAALLTLYLLVTPASRAALDRED